MKFEEHIIRKYLEAMALDQLTEEYSAKGWKLARSTKIGKHDADLIAKKGNKTIVFEIKTGVYSEKDKKKLDGLSREAREKGFEFRLVLANAPKERSIEVIGLEQLFYEQFIEEVPSDLDQLSSVTSIEGVYDCEIDEISIDEGKDIHIIGQGTVAVLLQYGPSQDGFSSDDSFPFSFNVKIIVREEKLVIEEILFLNVDTRSFYE